MGIFVISILGFVSTAVLAADCSRLSTPLELYDCALEKHPERPIVEWTLSAAEAAKAKAAQFANPELELKNTLGKNGGEKMGSLEAAISFPISDYLFLRSARKKTGLAEQRFIRTEAFELAFDLRRRLIHDLFRYRQVQNESVFVSEALEAFSHIEKQLKGRKARGPEQEITLNLVILAQSDYLLKNNHLSVEKLEIDSRFKTILGSTFQLDQKFLLGQRKVWPSADMRFSAANHFELQKAAAIKDQAYGEKKEALAASFPSLSAGPVFERSAEGPNVFNSYGFSINVGLPIFSINNGGRALAEAKRTKAELQYEVLEKNARIESELALKKYTSAVQALALSDNLATLAKRHEKIDQLFKQGLTSGSTIIEAHRQMWEFMESQHEHELTAVESLLTLNQLQGKDPSEVLR